MLEACCFDKDVIADERGDEHSGGRASVGAAECTTSSPLHNASSFAMVCFCCMDAWARLHLQDFISDMATNETGDKLLATRCGYAGVEG